MKRMLAVALLSMLSAAALLLAPTSQSLPGNCVQQPWWYGNALRQTTRTLCDGPITADGSWMRARNFYANAYYVPFTCSWSAYGGYCSGGYWMPVFDTGVETYRVDPDTVLPDEPGHIGGGPVPVAY